MNTVTDLCPFDLVLSRTPLPVGMGTEPSGDLLTHRQARIKWIAELGEAMKKSRRRFEQAQKRTKRNLNSRKHDRQKVVKRGDYVFIRKEKSSSGVGERHNLARIAEGPYRLT